MTYHLLFAIFVGSATFTKLGIIITCVYLKKERK